MSYRNLQGGAPSGNCVKQMTNHGAKDEPEWIRKVKSEGAVPFLEPDNCPNGWTSPPGDKFMVRGPEYFSTKVKIPAGEYLLKPLGFDWLRGSVKIGEILNHPNSRIRKALEDEFLTGNKPFVWAFNLQVPSKENYSAIAYFVAAEPILEGSLMDQFLRGDDTFRNSRLKLIANIVKGPWIVRKAVGEQAICIIGRALSCKYCVAENFFEADIDIGSSMIASAIVHLAFGYITTLTVDLAFLIESQTESELPEQILGAFRFSELNPSSAQPFEPSSDSSAITLPSRVLRKTVQYLAHTVSMALVTMKGVPEIKQSNIADHENVCYQHFFWVHSYPWKELELGVPASTLLSLC
ncbi:hypothetical protein Nepgr_030450 [Nepenthes gracilis]|uniref:Protein ENHANCED DISEASE RESISTANCE 2 C-terminal domain-containing protein n=1 Tax=Nepenthes gracilis TaxID=150966 RepID=A0AAD3TH02_NEPGR|nr:hypothetical protein Nepgr_030450 [Nepenthes gracilis]